MLINLADATNDANHYTKPPPTTPSRSVVTKIEHFDGRTSKPSAVMLSWQDEN